MFISKYYIIIKMVNLSTVTISEAIRLAQRGSLLHDCVEKIAYRLYLDHSEREADANWFEAQGYLGCWVDANIRYYNLRLSSASDFIQACLDTGQRVTHGQSDLKYGLAEKIVEDIESSSSHLFAAV
jgi:hypothetical protein